MEKEFEIGNYVTFKTHPLLYNMYIKGDGKYVPPIMLIKEILFENKEKKEFDEATGEKIADREKFICVYFDDNKSEFVEVHLYKSQLSGIEYLKIARVNEKKSESESTSLISEVLAYDKMSYEYGKIVYFKTKKIEALKKRESSKIDVSTKKIDGEDTEIENEEKKITRHYVVNYITPDFVVSGFKKETYNDLFYGNGKPKRKVSTELIKVKWFNPFQQKFTEQFLPIEFFIDFNPFIKINS
ncbi:MAG: hypothetical protein K2P85_09175 [Flavobacteriaceae bacterium]|nr:hypothetical protein [Flavobacteriaceae bacterium]